MNHLKPMKYILLAVAVLGLTACGDTEEKASVDNTKDNPLVNIATQAGDKAKKAVQQEKDNLPQ